MSILSTPDNGWLVPAEFRRLTPNRYSKIFQSGRRQPVELVVYHFTAGGFEGSLRWLTSRDASASAHFIVRKNGEVWQLAPLEDRCWHAGGVSSTWRKKGQVNNRSIGIEIENWGQLKKATVHGVTQVQTYKMTPFTSAPFEAPDKTLWDPYTPEQMKSLETLTARLVSVFPILVSEPIERTDIASARLTGHQHVDPTRKSDPGPAFNWELIFKAAGR